MEHLPLYLKKFRQLRVDSQRVAGHKLESPYKPALLLAVLEGIEENFILHNRIIISAELIVAFKAHCRLLSPGPEYAACPFALPFFHLRSSGFWHLRARPGHELILTSSHSVRSFGHLREVVDCAQLNPDLWALLQDPLAREELRQALLLRYFPLTRHLYRPHAGQEQLDVLGQQLLQESPAAYQVLTAQDDETEVMARSAAFARTVPQAYNHTCAVSGLQLISTTGSTPLLDACHIVPWSRTHDDHITNGLALCPNLHRAFDRHLFWIDEDYRVQLAPGFSELSGHDYGVQRFAGKELQLPQRREWWPRRENLAAQRELSRS